MEKIGKLKIELAVLLMISLVAFGGFVSLGVSDDSESQLSMGDGSEEINDGNELTGDFKIKKPKIIKKIQKAIDKAIKRESPKPVIPVSPSKPPVINTSLQPPVNLQAPKQVTCREASGGKAICTRYCTDPKLDLSSLDIVHGDRGLFDCKSNEYCCENQGNANKPNAQLTCKQAAKKTGLSDGACSKNPYGSVPCSGVFPLARAQTVGKTSDCQVCCGKV